MGLFNLFNKAPGAANEPTGPYPELSTNILYHMLFCDDIRLYQQQMKPPYTYPYNILFAEKPDQQDLQKVLSDNSIESRLKILAFNTLLSSGMKSTGKELLGVIVEVGLDGGLDVLAAFQDGTARYINQSGKIIIWESPNAQSKNITQELFSASDEIVKKIGPWDQLRKSAPPKGNVRISFLVSDGLYFGEGGINVLFNDPMASPALSAATKLMQYLISIADK